MLNPSHSVILKDSYLPLIRFDLYPVGKRDPKRETIENTESDKETEIMSERVN